MRAIVAIVRARGPRRLAAAGWFALAAVVAIGAGDPSTVDARPEVARHRGASWWPRSSRATAAEARAEVVRLRAALADRDREIAALRAEVGRLRASAPAIPPPTTVAKTLPRRIAPLPAAPRETAVEEWKPTDTLSVFLGLDGSKQPQDFGVNAHFGGRFAANWGVPVWKERGVGLQVGTALNFTEYAVGVVERIESSSGRDQSFTTVGLYGRDPRGRYNWGAGYDFLYQDAFTKTHLGQWRFRGGVATSPRDEVGFNVALKGRDDTGYFGSTPVALSVINQGVLYYTRTWQTATATTLWLGLADGHDQTNIALGDLAPERTEFVYGAQIDVPLTDRLKLFGQANFIRPADSGTVDAFLGFEFHPGGKLLARGGKPGPYDPVLPVAGNPTFSTDLRRRPGRR